jgi:putative PIN family toxin of toxin-antitoxin system
LTTDSTRLRAVFDTNVIIAALLSRNPDSPLVELLRRWRNNEFELLYCDNLWGEYLDKLIAKGIEPDKRRRFFDDLVSQSTLIQISPADVIPRIPDDPDDDLIIACAIAGGATHLVTYDEHLHAPGEEYKGVRILDGLHFLYVLRGNAPPSH